MAGKDPKDLSQFEPSLIKQKSRLVVSFYFRKMANAEALTKLYREFVSRLMDLARQRALGCPTEESYHNSDTLADLVEEYHISSLIETAWSGRLTQTEKLVFERTIGDEERRFAYGLHVVSQCLDLSASIGTQLEVDGETHLYNEVTNELVPMPLVDQIDLVWLCVYLNLDLGTYTHVLVDEKQDVTRVLYLFVMQIVRGNANLLHPISPRLPPENV